MATTLTRFQFLRSLLAALVAPLGVRPRAKAAAEAQDGRFVMIHGASLFHLHEIADGVPGGGLAYLAGLAEETRPGAKTVMFDLWPPASIIPDPSVRIWPRPRRVGLTPRVVIGTVDELVADFRAGLERAAEISRCREHITADFDPHAETQRALRAAGVDSFRELPPASPELLAAVQDKRAALIASSGGGVTIPADPGVTIPAV